MDLFIIVAAVLGVGGVVSASVYNLVNSATSNASIAVIGASMVATSSTTAPSAISITIKNNGGSTISCLTATSCVILLAGTNTGAGTAPSCPVTTCTIISAPLGWALAGGINQPLSFSFGGASLALAPGAQTSFTLSDTGLTLGTSPTMPTHGSTVTLNVVFGTASSQVTVTAQ